MQGSICGAQGVRYGYDARCEMLGENGLITVGSLAAAAVTTHNAAGSTTPIVRSWTDLFLDAYRAEDEDFVRCIREELPAAGRRPRRQGGGHGGQRRQPLDPRAAARAAGRGRSGRP